MHASTALNYNTVYKRYHLPVKNGTTLNNNLIEFKDYVFWMYFIVEYDKQVIPTYICFLCHAIEMIWANYFLDTSCATFCYNLRIHIILLREFILLTSSIICGIFTSMPILATESMLD